MAIVVAGSPVVNAARSLTDFAREHQLGLTRFAYLLCGDRHRAEDLVQDVLTAMWKRFGDTLPLDNPLAYARTAVANAHTSRARRRSSGEHTFGLVKRDAPTPEPADGDEIWTALSRLNTRQRSVLVLRYYLDLPDAEIAGLLDCRIGTVSSAASRAVAAMRADPGLAAFGRNQS